MGKKISKIIKRFLLIFLIGATIMFGIYCFFISSPKQVFKSIFSNETQVTGKSVDNVNGVYSRSVPLNKTISVFSSCSVSSVNYYVVVINDQYKYYQSTCMMTRLEDEGSIDKLDIKYDEEANYYWLKYKNEKFVKDVSVDTIEPANNFLKNSKNIKLDALNFIVLSTESFEEPYNFNGTIPNYTGTSEIDFSYNEDNSFSLDISVIDSSADLSKSYNYNLTVYDFDSFPYFYSFSNSIVIMEPNMVNGRYQYNLKSLKTDYNLMNKLPIKVDGVVVNYDDYNVFIYYEVYSFKFRVFFSKYENFCSDSANKEDISYYEFVINYDHGKADLKKPVFVKAYTVGNGCDEIKGLLEE